MEPQGHTLALTALQGSFLMMPFPPPHAPSCLVCRRSVLPAYRHWAPALGRGGLPAPTGSMPHPFSGSSHTLHTLLLRTLSPHTLPVSSFRPQLSPPLTAYPDTPMLAATPVFCSFLGKMFGHFWGNMWVHTQEWDRTQGTCASPPVPSVSGTITTC